MKCIGRLVTAAIVMAASAAPAHAQSITSLLTPQERVAAGLSKLTPSEIVSLDAALLRIVAGFLTPGLAAGPGNSARSDLDLFDVRGRATVYLEPSDALTFYLWSGEPVAYLDDDSVYGFNGTHLGWYHNGAVYDHDGDVIAAPASMFQGSVTSGSARGLRGLRPLKGLKELKPLKPLFGMSWSRMPAAVFFLQGID